MTTSSPIPDPTPAPLVSYVDAVRWADAALEQVGREDWTRRVRTATTGNELGDLLHDVRAVMLPTWDAELCRHDPVLSRACNALDNAWQTVRVAEMIAETPDDDDSDSEPEGLDEFVTSYVETALWASTDDDGEPLDRDHSADDIAPESLASMRADCAAFLRDNAQHIGERYARAGHDFLLTRNRHGAGFWDGDWPSDAGRILTDAAHVYGSSDLYTGDDGRLYVS